MLLRQDFYAYYERYGSNRIVLSFPNTGMAWPSFTKGILSGPRKTRSVVPVLARLCPQGHSYFQKCVSTPSLKIFRFIRTPTRAIPSSRPSEGRSYRHERDGYDGRW